MQGLTETPFNKKKKEKLRKISLSACTLIYFFCPFFFSFSQVGKKNEISEHHLQRASARFQKWANFDSTVLLFLFSKGRKSLLFFWDHAFFFLFFFALFASDAIMKKC